ncbi:hypothetical protein [Streptomyces corynorhini]|uniref:Uncharacterized protein n=1 Tax=Streptomyces corynorhini TaxID=2282652 RepID=A0A370B5M0_9ACTN|nr:hypothetical protein [Streptomyces corynorhini]RDG35394.1 hypothetical protein DVH02_25555 [Streptomyces corynorhini]
MTRYDYPGAPARQGDGPGAPVFALMRAWAAGIVVLLFTEYLQATVVYDYLASDSALESFGGRLMLIHLPNAMCIALATWAAGRVHSDPYRESPAQHLPAAFTVPVVAQVINLALQWDGLVAEGVLMSNAVLVLGCVTGYAVERLQED